MKSSSAESKTTPVLVIGNAGVGKSTLINYLLGRKIELVKDIANQNTMDVVGGHSAPVISHSFSTPGTDKIDKFDNEIEKISYYDTPPFAFNDKTDQSMEEELTNRVNQVREQNGVIIFVMSARSINSFSALCSLRKLLEKFCEERTNAATCHTLFVVTNTNGEGNTKYDLTGLKEEQGKKQPRIECGFIKNEGFVYSVIGSDGQDVGLTLMNRARFPIDFPKDVDSLMQKKEKYLPFILQSAAELGLVPETDVPNRITSSDMVAHIMETGQDDTIQPILEKMRDPDNWIFVNMLDEKNKNDIHQWIKQHTLRKTSVPKLSSRAFIACLTKDSTSPSTEKEFENILDFQI